MSGSSVNQKIGLARLPVSPGGARIYKSEIDGIWKEALKAEAGDPPGKPVTAQEAKALQDLMDAPLSRGARKYLQQILAQVPELLQAADAGDGGNGLISPAGARKPVYLNDLGWPVPRSDLSGTPTTAEAEEGFYRLAFLVSRSVESGDGKLAGLDGLSLAAKAKLIDHAVAMAKKSRTAEAPLPGLSADETSQLRSSAFTVLWQLGRSLPPSGATKQLSDRIHDELVKMTDAEPNKRLGQHMARMLDREDYKSTIAPSQKADCEAIFAERFPQKFDVGNILDAQGYISWEHVCGQGEGFFKSFVANLQKKNVHGAKFVKVSEGWNKASFELKFDPARGEGGRVKGIKIDVREFSNDMFDAVGQKKGFSYGGHSSIGNNQEKSMERALLKGLKASSPQLAVLDLCAGLDNLDDDLEQLGDVEVLTTFGSSFFWKGKLKDDSGQEFEGVTRSEGMESIIAAFESLSNEHDYEQMRSNVSKGIQHYSHERNPNVVFPTLKDYREVRWMHLDGDDDGRMDANDALYQFGLKQATKDLAHEYVLKDSGAFDELDGDTIKDAVLDLNVATHYNSETSSNWGGVEHKFQADGFFDGSGSSELLRFKPGKNHDGKPTFNVQVSSRLAHASREAMESLVAYQAFMWLADSNKVDGLSEADRKLMGLTLAGFALNYDGNSRWEDQRIWKQLLQVLRLPADLPYAPLANLIDAEHHDYSGSMKMVNEYKKSISAESLKALDAKPVGRPGDGPPAIA